VTVRERARFEPVRTGLALARVLHRLYPREWDFDKLDRLVADRRVLAAIDAQLPLDAIVDVYRAELATFASRREKYLLYADRACAARETSTSLAEYEKTIVH
jgi:uncharacterized protein YbbC (DUF1343 family)